VRNLANFGAFIEIEDGIDGLLHVSDLSWTKKISHPSELLNKDNSIKCIVLSVDQEKQRIALGLKQTTENPWLKAIPEKYIPGQIVKGKVTKLTNFGVFVELEPELEGLLHISELSDHKVEGPQDVVQLQDVVEVKILRVDSDDRKIGLSLKRAQWAAEDSSEQKKIDNTPQRGGLDELDGSGSQLIDHSLLQKHIQPVKIENSQTPPPSKDETEVPQNHDPDSNSDTTNKNPENPNETQTS